jgi:hypothetical protein
MVLMLWGFLVSSWRLWEPQEIKLGVHVSRPTEEPIRRPERGEWMGADKNSSGRMNLVYALNSQSRIPTRVCQGQVVTTDLPTLGTNPNLKQHGSTIQEAKDLGNLRCLGGRSEVTRRTIRVEQADGPQGHGGLSKKATRTSSMHPP